MIFNNNTIYGKVWKITKEEKYLDLQMTTGEKDRDGNWVNSRWYPRCIGHAFNSLKDCLKEGDKIIITKSKFTNESYDAKDGTKKSAFRFVIIEAQLDGERPAPVVEAVEPDSKTNDDSCPW